MSIVEMRHTTRTTKGDAREHWHEQALFALVGMMVMFGGQVMVLLPAWYLNLPALEVFIQALGFSAFWISLRLAYSIYRYAKV